MINKQLNSQRALLIFDLHIDKKRLSAAVGAGNIKKIDLFPLTSEFCLIHDIQDIISLRPGIKPEINLLNSADLIDRRVDAIREKVVQWSANLGNKTISGRPLKEWFMIERGISSWWFSLLSEKNTLKTEVFFNIAQLEAIDAVLSSQDFDLCIISIHQAHFLKALYALCERRRVRTFYLHVLARKKSLRRELRALLERGSITSSILKALVSLRSTISHAIAAKAASMLVKKKHERKDNSILCVSYFPSVDERLAEQGILRNKYMLALQEKIIQMKKGITWIWLFAPLEGYAFSDALKLSERFFNNGEDNFFLDEFMTIKVLFRSLCQWFRQIWILVFIHIKIKNNPLYLDLSIPETEIFLKNLMSESFCGRTGLEGILYFELFKRVFSVFRRHSYCIYFAEMHAWEKALNAAKQLEAPRIKSIGFQHASISLNFFHYFYSPLEMPEDKDLAFLPLPDILACNGETSLGLMERCGYPNLMKLEAIRHLYLNSYLKMSVSSKEEGIVLIAGSIDRKATRALVSLFYEAFPRPERFEVWLKAHPRLPFDEILPELNIDVRSCGYVIKNNPMQELLKPAKILLTVSFTPALEALAMDCKVIIPIFSDSMFMSPLKGHEKHYLKVSSPEELRMAVTSLLSNNQKAGSADVKRFIASNFCVDISLRRWQEILSR